jgi:hypothetical protein
VFSEPRFEQFYRPVLKFIKTCTIIYIENERMTARISKLLAILCFLLLLTSCPSDGPGPVITYPRIIIDTYEPHGGFPAGFPADTYLDLYDASGNHLAEDDNGNTDPNQTDSSRIDSTKFPALAAGLTSGTYYLKVKLGDSSKTTGPYAVRFLSVDVAAELPAYPTAFDITVDTYESMDAPEVAPPLSITPVNINLGKDNLGRILEPASDVDWLKLTLP